MLRADRTSGLIDQGFIFKDPPFLCYDDDHYPDHSLSVTFGTSVSKCLSFKYSSTLVITYMYVAFYITRLLRITKLH